MRLIFKGKYDGNPESIPHNEHMPNAHRFNEISDTNKLGIIMNFACFIITGSLFGLFCLISGAKSYSIFGPMLALITLLPHEILHALCFKKEVYFYTDIKNGLVFGVGPETMSKSRAILMNLLPNIVFGFVPLVLYLINNNLTLLGSMSVFTIGMGMIDYYNVKNIITQMPRGARTYMYETSSYWYVPEN